MIGTASICMRPVTVAPSRIASGGSIEPDLDLEGPRDGIGLRGNLADAAGSTSRIRSSVRMTVTYGSVGADRSNWAGTSKTASRPSWRASRTIICPA